MYSFILNKILYTIESFTNMDFRYNFKVGSKW